MAEFGFRKTTPDAEYSHNWINFQNQILSFTIAFSKNSVKAYLFSKAFPQGFLHDFLQNIQLKLIYFQKHFLKGSHAIFA